MIYLIFYLIGCILAYGTACAVHKEFKAFGGGGLPIFAFAAMVILSWIGFAISLQIAIDYRHSTVFYWKYKR